MDEKSINKTASMEPLLSTSTFIKVYSQVPVKSMLGNLLATTVKMFSGSKDLKISNYTELETFLILL